MSRRASPIYMRHSRVRRSAMQTSRTDVLPLLSQQDIVLARQAVRKISQELGFSQVDQTKMVTATRELARYTVIYGGGGVMIWAYLVDGGIIGLRLTFIDRGPGIADMGVAMMDGWT